MTQRLLYSALTISIFALLTPTSSRANQLNSKPVKSCHYSFSNKNSQSENVIRQINGQLNFIPKKNIKAPNSFSKIHNLEMLIHKNKLVLEEIERILRRQVYSKTSLFDSNQLSMIEYQYSRLKRNHEQNLEKIRVWAKSKRYSSSSISMKQLYRPRYEKLGNILRTWEAYTHGIAGELLASIYIKNPNFSEVTINDFITTKQRNILEEAGVLERSGKFEMDIVANNNRDWYEVKYLTEGYGNSPKFTNYLKNKTRATLKAARALDANGDKITFKIIIFGPGKLDQKFQTWLEKQDHFELIRM